MTTQTQEDNIQIPAPKHKPLTKEQRLAQMGDLMTCLESCTRDFLDELILTFNDEEALHQYQYAHSTKKKQDAIYNIITKDPVSGMNQYHAIRDFHHYVQASAESVKEAQDTMKSYRTGIRERVVQVSRDFEIKPETRDYQKEILGQLKCTKLIENGLKGYGKAVVVGHIIGKQDQVVAAANYIAVEVSKMAEAQHVDDKSLDGVKQVVKNVNAGINNLVASLQKEDGDLNAKADSLVAQTTEQRRHMKEKIEQFVSQGAGSNKS